MKKINKKGFTLVELIATVVVLGLVVSIGSYSIIAIINKSKEKDYALLISNIKDAVEACDIESQYTTSDGTHICADHQLTLGDLITHGFLNGNNKSSEEIITLVNPRDKKNIVNCEITYTKENGNIVITPVTSDNESCPTSY